MLARHIDSLFKKYLDYFPVVGVLGPRQVGKTTLVKQMLPGWTHLDLDVPAHFQMVSEDPMLFLETHPRQVVIDEAQRCPALFDALRVMVDRQRDHKGRFVLTGSSSPELMGFLTNSLAGRIGTLALGGITPRELMGAPLSSFYQWFQEPLTVEAVRSLMEEGVMPSDVVLRRWLWGGYPEPLLSGSRDFWQHWMQAYEQDYVYRDLSAWFPKLDKVRYQRFLGALARLSGTILNKADIARAVNVSESTVHDYLHIAEQTYLWRSLPGWSHQPLKSMVKKPKGYVVDTGLLHHWLRIQDEHALMLDLHVGQSFEAFVMEVFVRGLQASGVVNWTMSHYRTRNGAEVDLVLEGPFGILPIEIKKATHVPLKKCRALLQFIEDQQLPIGVVVCWADRFHWIHPKILVVPIGAL